MGQPLVLCATDLTEEGTRAVDMAIATARAMKTHILLVHAGDPVPESDDIPESVAPGLGALRARLVERNAIAREKLDAEVARCISVGIAAESTLVDGPPAEGILKVAEERHPALIVLGRRHRHNGFVGQTIDRVVRHAECPVLVAPPDAPPPESLANGRWLVGVDFSPHAAHAIAATRAVVDKCGGKLRLVHIAPPAGGEGQPYEERSPMQLLREEGLRENEAKLRALAATAAPGAEVEQVRTPDRPSQDLCRVAADMDATVIVVGTHGRSGIARFFLGSTAERLLRQATRPVLVVRDSPASVSTWYDEPKVPMSYLGPTRLLVAFDFSEPARRALDLARSLGAKLHTEIEIVHVHDVPLDVRMGLIATLTATSPPASVPHAGDDAMREALGQKLAEVAREVFGADAETVRTHVVSGHPVEAIIALAVERDADLIVVGTTGRTGVERMLLGSTAESLVRQSGVPVLTVH